MSCLLSTNPDPPRKIGDTAVVRCPHSQVCNVVWAEFSRTHAKHIRRPLIQRNGAN